MVKHLESDWTVTLQASDIYSIFALKIGYWVQSIFCRIRTKQDLNTSWTEGNKHFALARHSPIPLWNPCSLPKSTISGKYFCFACFVFCMFSTWTMLLPLWSNLPMWPPYHPLPLPPPLPPPLTPTEQFRRKNVDLSVRDFNWLNIHPIGLLLIGVTKKKLSYFCLQRTTCITQENEARNLNTSIRSQMIFGILEHMKLKS